jgi:sporulation protein YlmC with PRC-barrel domain
VKNSCLAALLVALVLPHAAAPAQADKPEQARAAPRNHDVYRGSKIIGAHLRDSRDRKLGVIKDIVIGSDRGEIAYAVVSFGGVAAPAHRYHAIPWKALRASDDGKYYVLNADEETVRKAPGFDPRSWPDTTDARWNAEVTRYWDRMVGQAPATGIAPGSGGNTASGR